MILTPAERTVLTKRLTEAEQALHDLTVGNMARVFIDQSGERIEYVTANSDKLKAYIMDIKISLGMPLRIAGPMRVRTL